MADTDFAALATRTNAKINIRVMGDMALWLFDAATTDTSALPTADTWRSWSPPDGAQPVGWLSSDGLTLSYSGDTETVLTGLNGEPTEYLREPGHWEAKLGGLECRTAMLGAYFGVGATSDGVIVNRRNMTPNARWHMVIGAVDTDGNPIVIVLLDLQVTSRDSMTIKGLDVVKLGLTFASRPSYQAALGTAASLEQLRVFGLNSDGTDPVQPDLPRDATLVIKSGEHSPIIRVGTVHTIINQEGTI